MRTVTAGTARYRGDSQTLARAAPEFCDFAIRRSIGPLSRDSASFSLRVHESSSGHDGGHEMSARVCASSSEILSLFENCGSEFRFHSKFTHYRLLSLPQNQRSDFSWNGPTMGSVHTLQTSLGRIARGHTFRVRILQIGCDCYRSRPL